MVRRFYGDLCRQTLQILIARKLLTEESFAEYLTAATGRPITQQLVSRWATGEEHFAGDLLVHASHHTGRPDVVFSLIARASGIVVGLASPPVDTSPERAVHSLGRLLVQTQAAVLEVLDPDGPGGTALDVAERDHLRRLAQDLRAKLDAIDSLLAPSANVRLT